ncbi:VOC family protein [Oscillospiraceae bacterium PP1C4]
MKYCGTLLAVSDMAKAKQFYETVLEQKVLLDLGVHVSFDGGVSLQEKYSELVGVDLPLHPQANNFELYFEVEDIEHWNTKLRAIDGIEFIHDAKEYPWGQRSMRFYDFDKHIVEIGESMVSVVKKFLEQGLSVEEAAERTMFPVEFVKQCL